MPPFRDTIHTVAQVRSVVNHTRPDRQTLLFSATFKRSVEQLAREVLTNPIRVVVGTVGEASDDIKQIVQVVSRQEEKWDWLRTRFVEFTSGRRMHVCIQHALVR